MKIVITNSNSNSESISIYMVTKMYKIYTQRYNSCLPILIILLFCVPSFSTSSFSNSCLPILIILLFCITVSSLCHPSLRHRSLHHPSLRHSLLSRIFECELVNTVTGVIAGAGVDNEQKSRRLAKRGMFLGVSSVGLNDLLV